MSSSVSEAILHRYFSHSSVLVRLPALSSRRVLTTEIYCAKDVCRSSHLLLWISQTRHKRIRYIKGIFPVHCRFVGVLDTCPMYVK